MCCIRLFTEAPWIHEHDGWYYLSFVQQFPGKIACVIGCSLERPWKCKGILSELAGNCNTYHHAIIDFKGRSSCIYHNGAIQTMGATFRRLVCIDYPYYQHDGSMKRVVVTTEGVLPAKSDS